MSLTNNEIKAIALASGFELKENGDLRPYVYEFARLLLAFDSFPGVKVGVGTSEGWAERIAKVVSGGIVGAGTMLPPKQPEINITVTSDTVRAAEIAKFVIPGVVRSQEMPEKDNPLDRLARLMVLNEELRRKNADLEKRLNNILSRLDALASEQE